MATIEEQIKVLEEEITKTKSNKATQGHLGKIKAKIAALRERKAEVMDLKSKNLVMLQSHWLGFRVLENLA